MDLVREAYLKKGVEFADRPVTVTCKLSFDWDVHKAANIKGCWCVVERCPTDGSDGGTAECRRFLMSNKNIAHQESSTSCKFNVELPWANIEGFRTPCLSSTSYTTMHYNDVIMGAMTFQITSIMIVYSTVSGADQGKHQSSASLAFVRGIHRWPVNSPHKWPVTRKMLPFDDVIMENNPIRTLGYT